MDRMVRRRELPLHWSLNRCIEDELFVMSGVNVDGKKKVIKKQRRSKNED
jgi:hypothetical protein